MLGGLTCSAAASAPSDFGPPNTSTDSARELGGTETGRDVHLADEAEQVNRGGMAAGRPRRRRGRGRAGLAA